MNLFLLFILYESILSEIPYVPPSLFQLLPVTPPISTRASVHTKLCPGHRLQSGMQIPSSKGGSDAPQRTDPTIKR